MHHGDSVLAAVGGADMPFDHVSEHEHFVFEVSPGAS